MKDGNARRGAAAPWIVLAASLLLTGVAVYAALATTRARAHARFAAAVQSARDRIDARLGTYVALLRGTAALFAASDEVSGADFRAYTARLDLRERYPGVQGIGFTRRVAAPELPAFERRVRAREHAGFHVWPDTARPEYHAILFLEPLDRRNQAAIGYDMFTEPTRREAMRRARDGATAAASGRVQLVQEIDDRKQAGFLLYVPVYRGGVEPATVAARRAALEGFVYAPFRGDDLFAGIFGRERRPRVAFRIYDGERPDGAMLLHDSRGAPPASPAPAFVDTVRIGNAGRTWTIVFTSTPALLEGVGRGLAPLVAVTGALLSALLFVLARAQARSRRRIEATAHEMEVLATALQARNLELAAADRSKSEFLATMSHEIRTPINAMIGYTQLLEMGLSGPVTEEQRTQLGRIAQSGRHLLVLIEDILDLSRIEAGRLQVQSARAHAAAVVDAALLLVRPQAAAKGITLAARCDGGRDASYVGDEQRVQQVLVNLLSNAVKFTPPGGRVVVECGVADHLPDDAGAAGPGPWTWIAVADTGAGIAPEMRQRIFQPFVQGEGGYTRAHGGAGLGLTISRRLAHLMGGALAVESVPGEGSRFTVWLPAVAPPVAPPVAPEAVAATRG